MDKPYEPPPPGITVFTVPLTEEIKELTGTNSPAQEWETEVTTLQMPVVALYDYTFTYPEVIDLTVCDSVKPGSDVTFTWIHKRTKLHRGTAQRAIESLRAKEKNGEKVLTRGKMHPNKKNKGGPPGYEYHILPYYSVRDKKNPYLEVDEIGLRQLSEPYFDKNGKKRKSLGNTAKRLWLVICNEQAKYGGCCLTTRQLAILLFGSAEKKHLDKIREALAALKERGVIYNARETGIWTPEEVSTDIWIAPNYDPCWHKPGAEEYKQPNFPPEPEKVDVERRRHEIDKLYLALSPKAGTETNDPGTETNASGIEIPAVRNGDKCPPEKSGTETNAVRNGDKCPPEKSGTETVLPTIELPTTPTVLLPTRSDWPANVEPTGDTQGFDSSCFEEQEPEADTPTSQESASPPSLPAIKNSSDGKILDSPNSESNTHHPEELEYLSIVEQWKSDTLKTFSGNFTRKDLDTFSPKLRDAFYERHGTLNKDQAVTLLMATTSSIASYLKFKGGPPATWKGRNALKQALDYRKQDDELHDALKAARTGVPSSESSFAGIIGDLSKEAPIDDFSKEPKVELPERREPSKEAKDRLSAYAQELKEIEAEGIRLENERAAQKKKELRSRL